MKTHPECMLMSEFFNPFHIGMYRAEVNGQLINVQPPYQPGCFYTSPKIKDGKIAYDKFFEEHHIVHEEEQARRLELLKLANLEFGYISHNHSFPMYEPARTWLKNVATKNIYMHRRDLVAQLSSYAVAFSTKSFAKFAKSPEIQSNISAPANVLEMLVDRIYQWHLLDKSDGEIIAYEDIDFTLGAAGFPYKQNTLPAVNKLDNETRQVVNQLAASLQEKICRIGKSA